MSRLIIHPNNKTEETALEAIFNALSIKYEKELDETEYLLSSRANEISLNKSIKQLDAGKGVKIALEDL